MSHIELAGRVAVVTGAASGIGRALAIRLAEESMHVVMADVDEDGLRATARSVDGDTTTVVTDVTDADAVERLARSVFEQHDEVALLCNNAGVIVGRGHPVWETPIDAWRTAFDINVMGVVHGLRSFLPSMLEQEQRSWVVNTASATSLFSSLTMTPAYAASKHAVLSLSENLFLHLRAREARVGASVLCPAKVASKITAGQDDCMPASDVAEHVLTAIRAGDFYIFPHDLDTQIRARAEAMLARDKPPAQSGDGRS